MFQIDKQLISTAAIELEYYAVPWDTGIFGFPVAQVGRLELHDPNQPGRALADVEPFLAWLAGQDIALVCCRLPLEQLAASMFLEDLGFRFVETVWHPRLENLQTFPELTQTLEVSRVTENDLPEIEAIAGKAFGHERFHVDPRLDPALGDKRYRSWVRNSLAHPTQQIWKIADGGSTIAFFVTEYTSEHCCHWHLTAVSPEFQGQGYGKKVWRTMLALHQQHGIEQVGTTVSGRNARVINLYGSLGFRLTAPEITLHWARRPLRPYPA